MSTQAFANFVSYVIIGLTVFVALQRVSLIAKRIVVLHVNTQQQIVLNKITRNEIKP